MRFSLFLAAFFCFPASVVAAATSPVPENLANLAQEASSAVVSISVVRERSSDGQDGRFLGSGFLVEASGLIVTNFHVVEGAREIYVSFADGRRRAASFVGSDRKSDIALVRVAPVSPARVLSLGDSDGTRPGDWVVAIGNPFGLGGSISAGIVSARNRQIDNETYDDFIQTDVAINRGSSGGPLLNLKGEVVGVNSALISPNGGSAGVSFAVPANTVRFVVSRLKARGVVQRGWIGANVMDLTQDLADAFGHASAAGALVGDVIASGPAARAGLAPGDIVTHVGAKAVGDSRQFQRVIAETTDGAVLPISFLRKRVEMKTQLTVAYRSPGPERVPTARIASGNDRGALFGMHMEDLSADTRSRLALGPAVPAVLVRSVSGGSAAAEADIKPGDVIIGLDQAPVPTVRAVKTLLTKSRGAGRKFVLVTLMRSGETVFKPLRMSEQKFDTAFKDLPK